MIKKFLSKAILTAAIIGCIGGAGVMNVSAGTVTLDVTSSNVSGMVPKDPYSKMTTKSDAEQSFYITLNKLSNGPSLYFTSYNANHKKVSGALKYEKISLGNTRSKDYSAKVYKNKSYYVYALAPSGYGNVRGIGRYCP